MASIKQRTNTALVTGGWQAYIGAGTLLYAFMDGTSLSSSVLTMYDTEQGQITTSGVAAPSINVWTQDTDFGTTVPVACYKDGSVVATLATVSANTHFGVPFADGLFVNKTGDTTHNASLKFLIKPLIKKTVDLGRGATTDEHTVFSGSGIIHGIRLRLGVATVNLATADLLVKDGSGGNTLITATNYATAGPSIWSPVTTTGIDDAGTAVTTAATGAYTNPGVAFFKGVHLSLAQGSAAEQNMKVDVLIEA